MALSANLNILAFGFGNSAFFWWGAGLIAVPILIHILNRQRFRIVNWAAMEFLLRAMRKNRKRLKLEQWILLAIRCLAVLLIGLALAEPHSDNTSSGAIAGQSGMNVIIIDNSYSTAYASPHTAVVGEDGKNLPPAHTHLEQEKQIAGLMVDMIQRGGGSVAVITAAKPELAAGGGTGKDVVKRAVLRPGLNYAAAKDFIEHIEQAYTGTDLPGAMQLANEFADEKPDNTNRNLYVLTDGTLSAWEGQRADALKRLGPEVARRFKVTHYHVAEDGGKPREQWNQVVWDLRAGESLVNLRFGGTLVPTVRGFGNGTQDPGFQIKMDDDKPLGLTRTVHPDPTSGPLSPPEVLTSEQLKVGGPHLFVASLVSPQGQGDKLPVDDKRYRVIDVSAELNVLIVQGQVSDQFGKSSGSFLKTALAPEDDSSAISITPKSKTHVTARLGSESDLKERSLRGYQAIILCGVRGLDEPEAKALEAFVRGGGSLITFVGENANPEIYNKVLLQHGLIPGEMIRKEDQRQTKSSYALDFNPKATNVHRFLESFRGEDNTGLITSRFQAFWKIDTSHNKAAETVLSFVPAPSDPRDKPDPAEAARHPMDTSHPPAITSQPLGQGVVVFVATTASPALDVGWHDLPGSDAWVQLLHEMLAGSVAGRDGWMNLQVGQPLIIPSRVEAFEPKLLDENKVGVPVETVVETDHSTSYRTPPLSKPGVYRLQLKSGTVVPIAVNVAPEEADVRTVNDAFIQHALGDIQMTVHGDDFSLKHILDADKQDNWTNTILIILLALLGVECFMAMWFGHYRRNQQDGGGADEPAAAPAAPPA